MLNAQGVLANLIPGGSVATLQLPRGRLAGCSSWRLRFAVYSNGVNSSRRSSSWQWDGYLRFSLSYRDVEELLAERGLSVDHVTVWRYWNLVENRRVAGGQVVQRQVLYRGQTLC